MRTLHFVASWTEVMENSLYLLWFMLIDNKQVIPLRQQLTNKNTKQSHIITHIYTYTVHFKKLHWISLDKSHENKSTLKVHWTVYISKENKQFLGKRPSLKYVSAMAHLTLKTVKDISRFKMGISVFKCTGCIFLQLFFFKSKIPYFYNL